MDILDQSELAASVRISETEARLLSMAVDYYRDAMSSGSPLVAGLSQRLREISEEFDDIMQSADAVD
jgi:hypothetical protein